MRHRISKSTRRRPYPSRPIGSVMRTQYGLIVLSVRGFRQNTKLKYMEFTRIVAQLRVLDSRAKSPIVTTLNKLRETDN